MKSLVSLTTLFMLAMSVGCGGKSVSTSGIPVHNRVFGAAHGTPTPLDREAAEQALQVWKPTRLAESCFICEISSSNWSGSDWTNVEKTLHELREATVEVTPDPLTEADKLNGVRWRETVALCAKAVRSFCLQGLYNRQPDKTWGEWNSSDSVSTAKLERNNDKWKIDVHGQTVGTPAKYTKVDPTQLPK